jgi:hypothetical protein
MLPSLASQMERFSANEWQPVAPGDKLCLSSMDAQVWLALNNLLVEPCCCAKYELDDYRRNALLRLKRNLHEVLLDQLPVLREMQRVLDELALGVDRAAPEQVKSSRLILEQVRTGNDNFGFRRDMKFS